MKTLVCYFKLRYSKLSTSTSKFKPTPIKLSSEVWITIKHFQVKRIDIEASIEVVIEEVSRGINMGACVSRQLENWHVSQGAVLHAVGEPKELAQQAVRGLKRRHARGDPVGDVEDFAISVNFAARGNRSVGVAVGERAVHRCGAGNGRVGCGGVGESWDCERKGNGAE